MRKERVNSKNSILKKISISIGAVLVFAVVVASFYWFSMPKEARNMMTFMMFSGENYDAYEEYQVIERNEEKMKPSGSDITVADSEEGDGNVNVSTITEMVKNDTSSMLKKGMVQTNNDNQYTGWQVLADEGAAEGENPYGPSPLSYYTAGVATNLHSQIIMVAELEGVDLENVTVEVCNNFRWDKMLEADGTGHLDLCDVNIIIESDLPETTIESIKETALNAWAVGEALMNKTAVEPNLLINEDDWNYYGATPGTSKSDESFDGDVRLSYVNDVAKFPEHVELFEKEDESAFIDFDAFSNMEFQIYAISESANDIDRPYLKKVTVSTPTSETWTILSDEFMGEDDIPLAPTSLEYFTIGTSLCLTSQTTLVSAMMGLEYTDYRVEHMFEYGQENINTAEMIGTTDLVHSYVFIKSDESAEEIETFFKKSLALCFAGEGLVNETEMNIGLYLNGTEID